MAEDQAGPAGQEDNGEGKPGDEYRFAAGSAEADAAVFVGELVEEPGEVLGTIVSDDRSPTFEEIRFRLGPSVVVSPGDFVAAEGCDRDGSLVSWVLCRVLDVHEVNPHEDPQSATVRDVLPFPSTYAGEGESTVIYRLVRCEPVEELPAADGRIGDPTEIRTLPGLETRCADPARKWSQPPWASRPTLTRACTSGSFTAIARSPSRSTTALCSGTS